MEQRVSLITLGVVVGDRPQRAADAGALEEYREH